MKELYAALVKTYGDKLGALLRYVGTGDCDDVILLDNCGVECEYTFGSQAVSIQKMLDRRIQ